MKGSAERADYGFDAPGIMVGLLAAGAICFAVGAAMVASLDGWVQFAGLVIAAVAAVPLGLGVAMLVYGIVGKQRMRDHIMGMIDWTGSEQVLDVGVGRGLLLIGAAKRLTRGGRATGIDIWRTEDLSDNGLEQLAANVAVEGVESRIAVMTEDARRMPFRDASFDVVLSLFCIHNIDDKAEQDIALREIVRVLKPGGRVLIGEWLPTHRYASVLAEAGMSVLSSRTHFRTALSLMWLVDARKPEV